MANIIFDYDGTLHETMRIYEPAFRSTFKWLTDSGYVQPQEISSKDISYWLGFNSTDMWSNFQPGLDPEIREKARVMLGEDMARRAESGEGALYPGTNEMLASLKKQGHTLFFLSNCRIHYMERHKRVFGLDSYIDHFYCCEEFDFLPKYQIFRLFSLQYQGRFIVVGDRFHDIETATRNGLKSIGCGYGYGTPEELAGADIIVNDVSEIPAAVQKLLI